MENTNNKKAVARVSGTAPGGGGRFPVRKAQVFPLEPSASCCEGEKLDEPQDRPWSMGLASRATLFVGVLFAFTFLGPGLETRGLWSSTRKQQAVP